MSRVLLLQGPAGPFFRKLQDFLEAENFDVWRVCFNAGDMLFSSNKNRIAFWGNKAEWRDFFANLLVPGDVDCIILFGSERPAHKIARDVAAAIGVRVIALEEGYLRPGNITIEDGGNNASSPIAGQLPPYENLFPQDKRKYVPEIRGQRSMVSHGTIYYAIRTIFSYGKQRELFHRHISPLPEIFYWARNAYRKLSAQRSEFPKIQNLLEHWDGKYFLVPLQVAADGNLRQAALGWNSHRLISSALRSFSRSAPDDARLVFKIHPMERGHSNLAPLVRSAAKILGVEDRVDVICTGSLGLLARHAAGMITINSSSGLSAIYHGIPLLVIGNAIYANPILAVCAHGNPDFDAFWSHKQVASEAVRKAYIAWLKQEALYPGDFYAPDGIDLACKGILEKLNSTAVLPRQMEKLRAIR
jgi:capsular polysaccharide export protein